MADYNESRNRSRIGYPDDGAVHTRRATADEVAYRNAYVRGQNSHEIRQHGRQITDINRHIEQERIDRDRNKTAVGILLGIAIASALGLLGAIFYFASRKDEARIAPAPVQTVQPQTSNQPTSNQPNVTQPQSTQRTTIIERLREVPVAQPETQVEPAPPQQQIVVPAPAPANPSTNAPSNAPTSGAAPTQSTGTPNQSVQQPTTQGNSSQVQTNTDSNSQPTENSVQPAQTQNGQVQPANGAQSEQSEANSYQIELPNQ